MVDLDELHRLWPAPEGDPFKQHVDLANLHAVATTYRNAGAERLVMVGVIVHDRDRYEGALGEPLLLCRLRPRPHRVEARLTARHEPGDERDWHVRRAPQLEEMLDAAATADITVDVGDETPAQVATRVLADTHFAE